jgi:hypothetical protein
MADPEQHCPACGSEEIYRGLDRRKQFAIWYLGVMGLAYLLAVRVLIPVYLLWLLLPLALPFRKRWRCRNCGVMLADA